MGLTGWLGTGELSAQQPTSPTGPARAELVAVENQVELLTRGAPRWVKAASGEKLYNLDSIRTGPDSRVMIKFSDPEDQSTIHLGPESQITIQPKPEERKGLFLLRGILSFFHRNEPDDIGVETPNSTLGTKGTEFVVEVRTENGVTHTALHMVDGMVEVTGTAGPSILVTNRQGAVIEGDQAPRLIPSGLLVHLALQWALYYPAVLNLDDLRLTPDEQAVLADSLGAYRAGDVQAALRAYPAQRPEASPDEKVYRAALLLAVGGVAGAEALLVNAEVQAAPEEAGRIGQLVDALRTLIAAVTGSASPKMDPATLSTQWLATSYWEQMRHSDDQALRRARQAARESARLAPEFGFASARVAELEFSFGRTRTAEAHLASALEASPHHAPGLALKGFLLAAEFRVREATNWFQRAIDVDPGLGNAWLGRGLCRIRLGQSAAGREDLLVAASLEPQRSFLRSYLGKAFAEAGDLDRADAELELAKQLDPEDPTPWLYGALVDREARRVNQSIRELEHSIDLNDNRSLYRSRMLLDQDRAVRSSSLATLYQSAGLDEVAIQEAARAVGYDYANYSAHLFLSESYNVLRDPTRFNLRYETPWFGELLLANLLSPVGGTPLSQNISQQEYARLFERNRIGLSSASEYRSDGQFRELASQYGRFGRTAWALDLDYQHNDGVRPNNELDRIEWYTTVKQQLTARDSLLFLGKYQDYSSGDNFQRYDQDASSRTYSFEEEQSPLLALGYHHEWSPGLHTLVLGSRLESRQRFEEDGVNSLILATNAAGQVTQVYTVGTDLAGNDIGGIDYDYKGEFETWSGELNQIVQKTPHTLVVGGRLQRGEFETQNDLSNVQPGALAGFFQDPPASDTITSDFERDALYAYYTLQPIEQLFVTAGLAYDRVLFPANYRNPPISAGEEEEEAFDPKGGVIWNPMPDLTLRGAYARSLGGASFDESFRLEPTQIAGFNQAYRTVVSESVVGSVSAPRTENISGALDYKFKAGTYLGLSGERIDSEVRRTIGVFGFDNSFNPQSVVPFTTREHLDYEESSLAAYLHQMIDEAWVVGARYRFTHSTLHTLWPSVPTTLNLNPSSDRTEEADLHQVHLFLLFNHPTGIFARAESDWYHQESDGYQPALDNENFWQHNVFVGYRFARQRGEASVGVLNLTDEDYHLNPLNLYTELPRERAFVARLKFNF